MNRVVDFGWFRLRRMYVGYISTESAVSEVGAILRLLFHPKFCTLYVCVIYFYIPTYYLEDKQKLYTLPALYFEKSDFKV